MILSVARKYHMPDVTKLQLFILQYHTYEPRRCLVRLVIFSAIRLDLKSTDPDHVLARLHAEDEDPVTAEYDVFITPDLAEKIYLLQYPIRNREQPYNDRHGAMPTEMRIKPGAGFMEMDVEMNASVNFNKRQGLVWGDAMRKAQAAGVSTFGAAAGFAPVPVPRGRGAGSRGGEAQEQSMDSSLARFQDAVNRGNVFRKQTLGGQIVKDETGLQPNYMLGAFVGSTSASLKTQNGARAVC